MLLEKGLIQRANNEYGSPVIFVAMKDGHHAHVHCLSCTENGHSIPCIVDLSDKLQGASNFSFIDLQSACHQVHLEPEDVL